MLAAETEEVLDALTREYRPFRTGVYDEHEFVSWSESRQPWVLHCSGPPRCGKTTFAASTALRFKADYSAHVAVVSIFLEYLNVSAQVAIETQSASAMHHVFCSLLDQMNHQSAPSPASTPASFSAEHRADGASASLDDLRHRIRAAAQHFSRVFLLVDGVGQFFGLQSSDLRDELLAFDNFSVMFIGHPLYGLSWASDECASCHDPRSYGVGAECEKCGVYYCLSCSDRAECCEKTLLETRTVEVLLTNYDDLDEYLDSRLGKVFEAYDIRSSAANAIEKECGGCFSLAKLAADSLLSSHAYTEVEIVRDRLPAYQIRYFNFALWHVANQSRQSDVRLGQAVLALVALSGPSPLSFRQLTDALSYIDRDKRQFKSSITRSRICQVTRGWLLVDRTKRSEARLFADSAYAYLQDECPGFFREALSESDDLGILCSRIIMEALSRHVYSESQSSPRQIVDQLDEEPLVAYALENWATYLRKSIKAQRHLHIPGCNDLFSSPALRRLLFITAAQIPELPLADVPAAGHPLHIAASMGIVALLDHFLELNPCADIPDVETGRTPLMVACAARHLDVVRRLSSLNVDPTIECSDGRTALWYAVKAGRLDVVRFLLDAGGRSLIGARRGRADSMIMLAADLYQQTDEQDGPRLHERGMILREVLEADDAALRVTDLRGKTALHRAADHVHMPLLMLMLGSEYYRRVIDYPEENDMKRTALMNIICTQSWPEFGVREEAVKLLISSGACMNVQDGRGRTVLHYAAKSDQHLDIVNMLIANGARLDLQDSLGWTPAHVARAYSSSGIAEALDAARASGVPAAGNGLTLSAATANVQGLRATNVARSVPHPRETGVQEGGEEIQQHCLTMSHQTKSAAPHLTGPLHLSGGSNMLGYNALHLAVAYADDAADVRALLEGDECDVNAANLHQQTALHLAVERLRKVHDGPPFYEEQEKAVGKEIFEILLRSPHIDVNRQDHHHHRPIDMALHFPFDLIHVALDLLNAGAELRGTTYNVDRLLRHALQRPKAPTVHAIRTLIAAGANLFQQYNYRGDGKTPWQIAKCRGLDEEVLRVIEAEEWKCLRGTASRWEDDGHLQRRGE